MVTGLDLFREAFAPHHRSFVLIGGVACHLAMSAIVAILQRLYMLS